MALLESLLPPLAGLRVLDAGCGGGEYVSALVARGADALGIACTKGKLESARAGSSTWTRRTSRRSRAD
jgi:2-polyprenyl-3-methyl-5-hydroxy-6-metoxy-1,4-benzoquinol methylase